MVKIRWALLLSALVVSFVAFELFQNNSQKRSSSPTLAFIERFMTNPNGTYSSFLKDFPSTNPDLVAGHEALSESLGIWMQIAVLQRDETRFEQSYELLHNYFLAPQRYVRWKLNSDGRSEVNTNALGDDFRITKALLDAYDLWQKENYLITAQEIVDTLQSSLVIGEYFVDFRDFSNGWTPDTLSIVYIDTLALEVMERHGLINQSLLYKHMDLLRNLPNEGPFYPKTFVVTTGKYTFDDDINLIDQLIVALHSADLGLPTVSLIDFLKQELSIQGKLAGRYDRISRLPTVEYESPAVYGLSLLLALKTNDKAWARELYLHMIAMRDKDSDFKGGYVFGGDSHMFDNLIPLLAEVSYQQLK